MLARHFQSKKDDFILPPLNLAPDSAGNIALMAGDKVLTLNFDKHIQKEREKHSGDSEAYQHLDTSELEKEHGGKG
jgi:hypothetical protein